MYLLVLSENYKTSLHSRTTVFPGFAGTFSFEARLTPLNLALLEKREKQRFNEFCHSPSFCVEKLGFLGKEKDRKTSLRSREINLLRRLRRQLPLRGELEHP